MMRFRLRYQQHDFELAEGQFVIGRSTTCQLSLDDPLVSRAHAALNVSGDGVVLEDLGSRNGVRVNGQRVEAARRLEHGDRIGIGSQEMILLRKREAQTETIAQAPPTQRFEAFGLLGGLADKALALGRAEEAERILSSHLQQILDDAQHGYDAGTDVTGRASRYAARLASLTGAGRWIDYALQLHTALRRPLPADVVDELYNAMRKAKVDLPLLRKYLEVLRQAASELGPADRFLVGRIEGLERLAALK